MLAKRFYSIMIGLLFMSFLSGCSTPNSFARYKGRALKLGIPIYQGIPPQEHTYKSLGPIKGEYKSGWFDDAAFSMTKALEDLAKNAQETKANAIIKVNFSTKGSLCIYDGEAVIFDKLPDE